MNQQSSFICFCSLEPTGASSTKSRVFATRSKLAAIPALSMQLDEGSMVHELMVSDVSLRDLATGKERRACATEKRVGKDVFVEFPLEGSEECTENPSEY